MVDPRDGVKNACWRCGASAELEKTTRTVTRDDFLPAKLIFGSFSTRLCDTLRARFNAPRRRRYGYLYQRRLVIELLKPNERSSDKTNIF